MQPGTQLGLVQTILAAGSIIQDHNDMDVALMKYSALPGGALSRLNARYTYRQSPKASYSLPSLLALLCLRA